MLFLSSYETKTRKDSINRTAPLHHYSNVSRRILDENLTDRWIGRRGPVEWPRRSPDLTVCEFFLWGSLRDRVYKRLSRNTRELTAYIREEMTTFTPNSCRKAYDSFVRRCSICIQQEGVQFESLL